MSKGFLDGRFVQTQFIYRDTILAVAEDLMLRLLLKVEESWILAFHV